MIHLMAKRSGTSICKIENSLNLTGAAHRDLVEALAVWTRILARPLCEVENHTGCGTKTLILEVGRKWE
jgi:hypothetical protein